MAPTRGPIPDTFRVARAEKGAETMSPTLGHRRRPLSGRERFRAPKPPDPGVSRLSWGLLGANAGLFDGSRRNPRRRGPRATHPGGPRHRRRLAGRRHGSWAAAAGARRPGTPGTPRTPILEALGTVGGQARLVPLVRPSWRPSAPSAAGWPPSWVMGRYARRPGTPGTPRTPILEALGTVGGQARLVPLVRPSWRPSAPSAARHAWYPSCAHPGGPRHRRRLAAAVMGRGRRCPPGP